MDNDKEINNLDVNAPEVNTQEINREIDVDKIKTLDINADYTDEDAIYDEFQLLEMRHRERREKKDQRNLRGIAGKIHSIQDSGFSLLNRGLGAVKSLKNTLKTKTLHGLMAIKDNIKQRYLSDRDIVDSVVHSFEEISYLFNDKLKRQEYKKPISRLKEDSVALSLLRVTPLPLIYFKYHGSLRFKSNFSEGEIYPKIEDIIFNEPLAELLKKSVPFGTFMRSVSSSLIEFEFDIIEAILKVLLGTKTLNRSYFNISSHRICPFMYINGRIGGSARYDLSPSTINYLLVLSGFIYEFKDMYYPNNLNASINNIIAEANRESSLESIQENIKNFRDKYSEFDNYLSNEPKTLTFYSDLQTRDTELPIDLMNFRAFDKNNEYGDITDMLRLYDKRYGTEKSIYGNDFKFEEYELRKEILTALADTKFFK